MYKYHSAQVDNIIQRAQKLKLGTCSLGVPRRHSITFVKNSKFLNLLKKIEMLIHVIVDIDTFENIQSDQEFPSNFEFFVVRDDPKQVFCLVHNFIHKGKAPLANCISEKSRIHPSVVLDIDGHTIIRDSQDNQVFLKHMGNVIIEDGVRVDAMSTIHRANLDSTIIKKNVTICSHVNIGHNCFIGEETFIGPGTMIAGGSQIGKNCTIWQGALIKEKTKICDDVIIGMGSIVTKDIKEPGTYYGSPAKLMKKKT